MAANTSADDIQALLNAQTGRLTWPELARHFARGVVVVVDTSLDLVDTATCLVRDDAAGLERLHGQQLLHRATDEDALAWEAENPEFWAVVVAPWVVVQEIAARQD